MSGNLPQEPPVARPDRAAQRGKACLVFRVETDDRVTFVQIVDQTTNEILREIPAMDVVEFLRKRRDLTALFWGVEA